MGRELAKGTILEMLCYNHGIGNIDYAMAKQGLNIDNGLGNSDKRVVNFLRLEAISGVIVDLACTLKRDFTTRTS